MDADEIIARYGLVPAPGGRPLPRNLPRAGGRRRPRRGHLHLLPPARGEVSAWHRVDAVEIWHYHAGDALRLALSLDGVTTTSHRLGVGEGAWPQVVVPVGAWQSARPEGAWTLVGCTVAPAFEFAGFELAPPGWQPGGA